MNREDVLKAAEEAITKERERQYGKPEKNFTVIAELWTQYLRYKHGVYAELSMQDIANMMILLKVARNTGGGSNDTFIDIAGYAAIGAELSRYEKLERLDYVAGAEGETIDKGI